MSNAGHLDMDLRRPRKRLRRETRSCAECRRRKVKCSLATEDASTCVECSRRGILCVSLAPGSDYTLDPHHTVQAPSEGDRLERIEGLLTTLVEQQKTLPSQILSGLSGHTSEASTRSLERNHSDNAPLLSLFRDGIAARSSPQDTEIQLQAGFSENKISQRRAWQTVMQRFLISLLPSEQDAALIEKHTNAWALNLNVAPGAMPNTSRRPSSLTSNGSEEPSLISVGQALLHLALSIQQLPPDFDLGLLEMRDVECKVDAYIANVNSVVLADEELVCSTDGVTCLLLLGMIYINDGMLQKAWLTFRRAVDTSRLLGLHRSYSFSAREAGTTDAVAQRRLWLSVVMADAHVSLLLDLEPGSGREPFGHEGGWTDKYADDDTNFQRQLASLATQIAHRNLYQKGNDYSPTGTLDEALDSLKRSVPASWWHITLSPSERSVEAAYTFDRLLSHQWFFQLRAFTHFPYVFHSSHDKKFEYSRSSCLDSSCALLRNYLVLRRVGNTQLHCRVVDFGAFTAAVTVLLLHIQDSSLVVAHARKEDIHLVERVLRSMDGLANCSREAVAQQSAEVLRKLLNYRKGDTNTARNLQLTVPYFGTVTISPPNAHSNGITPPPITSSSFSHDEAHDTVPAAVNYRDEHQAPFDPEPAAIFQSSSLAFGNGPYAMDGADTLDALPLFGLDNTLFDSPLDLDILSWDWNHG